MYSLRYIETLEHQGRCCTVMLETVSGQYIGVVTVDEKVVARHVGKTCQDVHHKFYQELSA